MKNPFRVYLKSGERLFVNGAVLRVDRKVSVEFLNDVNFLLEAHVMQADEAVTPLRQLYFIVQAILIDKGKAVEAWEMYHILHKNFMNSFENPDIRAGLISANELAKAGRMYDCLKAIRALFRVEDELAGRTSAVGLEKEPVAACR